MPAPPTAPGVYIQEVSSGVRTITGVATSITAFVGSFRKGPTDQAIQVLSFSEFEQIFGGLERSSEASYAVFQFFQNGGGEAWICRAVSTGAMGAAKAKLQLSDKMKAGGTVLTITAKNEGEWGGEGSGLQGLRITIDDPPPGEPNPLKLFNLTVALVQPINGELQVVASESFLNLSMSVNASNFVKSVINDSVSGSRLIAIDNAAGSNPPLKTGTISGDLSAFTGLTSTIDKKLKIRISSSSLSQDKVISLGDQPIKTLQEVRSKLELAIQQAVPSEPAFAQARVQLLDSKQLKVIAGPASPFTASRIVTFEAEAGDNTVKDLKLDQDSSTANPSSYALGKGSIADTAQIGGDAGTSGNPPGVTELLAAMRFLDHVDLFNILCIPSASKVTGSSALDDDADKARGKSLTLLQSASTYCLDRRAVFLVDPPNDLSSVDSMRNWLQEHPELRNRNAAVFFPRVKIADPLNDYRLREIGPCGTIAGLFARTDSERGVWKAPAGTEATLRNTSGFTLPLNDSQNGVLNPLAINCLRNFPGYGKVCWGSRTLDGNDQKGSEWKYIPVRRLALFLEESLYRGTQWVVFEPNDEPLWAQIRLNIGAFMQDLFRQGAFQGSSPREAYFVKCDRETTTQNDINRGIVNIHVGFAPLKPAEFVVIRFQQIAGQLNT